MTSAMLKHGRYKIPQSFVDDIRENIANPAPNSGKMLCRIIEPNPASRLALSIIAYCDHGQLCLRFDQSYLLGDCDRFNPDVADGALNRATAFIIQSEALLSDAVPPKHRKEDITREDQRKWVRLEPYELVLTIRVTDNGRAHFGLDGLDSFPRWAMRAALGEAGDCLGMYAAALARRKAERSANSFTGYVADFMLLGFGTTNPRFAREPPAVKDGDAWAETMVEGREHLLEGYMAPVNFATLPYELLWEIGAYYVPADPMEVPVGAALDTIRALSVVSKRFRMLHQPVLFRTCRIDHQGQVDRLYEVLNGDRGFHFKPCPPDADAFTKELFEVENVMPIADVEPADDNKAFLRAAVLRFEVEHLAPRASASRWYDEEDEEAARQDLQRSSPMDLRFLIQMMPNLRSFALADQSPTLLYHLLDRTARVLHKFIDLEHLSYSYGKDLCEVRPRLAFGRVVGHMKRLSSLRLAYLEVGPCPWIMPGELGLGADAPDDDHELLGAALRDCVWFRPELLMREPPSASWLPTRLRTLELTDVFFRAPSEGAEAPNEWMMERLRKHCVLAGGTDDKQLEMNLMGLLDGEETPEADDEEWKVTWTTWPPDFHPFARIILTSQNTLRELSLDRIRGVPSSVFLHVLLSVGPRLERLRLWRHRGDTPALVRCCPNLTYLSLDAYTIADDSVRRMLEEDLPRTLTCLDVHQPWPAEELCAWLQGGRADLQTLVRLSLASWGEWLWSETQYALMRTIKDACATLDVGVDLPDSFEEWDRDQIQAEAHDNAEEQEQQAGMVVDAEAEDATTHVNAQEGHDVDQQMDDDGDLYVEADPPTAHVAEHPLD